MGRRYASTDAAASTDASTDATASSDAAAAGYIVPSRLDSFRLVERKCAGTPCGSA